MNTLNLLSSLKRKGIKIHLQGENLKIIAAEGKLTTAVLQEIKTHKQEIIALLKKYGSNSKIFLELGPVEKREYYPLSPAQRRLYFFYQVISDTVTYNLPSVLELATKPDKERLELLFRKLIERHESFRTSFDVVAQQPVQQIHAPVEVLFAIEHYDQPGLQIDKVIHRFIRPFDLSQAPLLRVGIAKIQKTQKYFLMIDMHHIISDGTSIGLLTKELVQFFAGEEILPLPLQYKEVAVWQNSKKYKENATGQERTWLESFAGELPVLDLPLDFPRPAVQSFAGHTVHFPIDSQVTTRLRKLALQEQVTPFHLLFTAYNILLAKLSGQEDIIVGTPASGRGHDDFQNIIGMFVNTLALRNFPAGGKTFKELLKEVKNRSITAFDNQEYPFEDLVAALGVERDTARSPLFDTMFALQNMDLHQDETLTEMMKPYYFEIGVVKFDLIMDIFENGDSLTGRISYSTALFQHDTIEKFANYYQAIITSVLNNPGQEIRQIEIMDATEKHQVIQQFNQTATPFPHDWGIPSLFAEQVEQTPHRIAVVFGDQLITYRELDEKATGLVQQLEKEGLPVSHGAIIGLMMERSIEMIIAIFGILKAGAAYLPIDPEFPQERIDYMLTDSGAQLLIKDNQEPGATLRLRGGDSSSSLITHRSSLAYIIYTSGSTGQPKGVMVEHRNVVRLVRNTNYIEIELSDRILQLSNFAFDGSIFDIFGTLLNGASLVLIEKKNILAIDRLVDVILREAITVFFLTTALFNTLVDLDLPGLKNTRKILFGGERVSLDHARRAMEYLGKDRLVHVYGPTETTVYSTYHHINNIPASAATIPIGKPLANATTYIFDKYEQPVPIAVTGHLHIGGDGLARGYLNNPELTSEKFIASKSYRSHRSYAPQALRGCTRRVLYKSGDLCRWLPGGEIEFVGRIDHQVKIRGFRIELGEIEHCLLEHKKIKEVLVTVSDDTADKRLCAYIVGHDPGQDISIEIRDYLAVQLPVYMIPAYFIQLEAFPLNRNGKIDRGKLPQPGGSVTTGPGGVHHVSPRDTIERKLVETWAETLELDIESIGIDDDFFALGGHSLKATVAMAKAHQAFSLQIPLTVLFQGPTVRQIAQYIKKHKKEDGIYADTFLPLEAVEKKEYYPLSSAQKRMYIVNRMEPDTTTYNMPVIHILEGEIDKDRLDNIFWHLVQRHESFRTSFSTQDGEPVQRVHDIQDIQFKINYLVTGGTSDSSLNSLSLVDECLHPFDLSYAPLLRVSLLKEAEQRHILFVDMHHIISDGVSCEILTREFLHLYSGKTLPTLQLQYKDVAAWQNQEAGKGKLKDQEKYWLEQFSDELPVLELPADYPRPQVQSFAGNSYHFETETGQLHGLHQIASKNQATLFMVLSAIYFILLHKLSGQEDIIIGTPVAGRRHADLQYIIGMFVNTPAIRTHPQGGKPFSAFIEEVKETSLRAFENQEYPFEDLVERVAVNRDMSRNPLFDVVFSLINLVTGINLEHTPRELPGLTVKPYALETHTAKFDLNLTCLEKDDRLSLTFEYCTKLFAAGTIEHFKNYFLKIIDQVVQDPEVPIANIEIMDAVEKQQVLELFNETATDYPKDKSIIDIFEEQVQHNPHRSALVFASQHLTYQEFDQEISRIATSLETEAQQAGNATLTVVGLMMDRSIEMITAIFGILKTGAAYLPLDSTFPQERKDYMLADSGAQLLVTGDRQKFAAKPLIACGRVPAALAYIMYTSGSTGQPKGVMVKDQNIVRLVKNTNYIEINPSDRILQLSNYAFDGSVFDIFGALLNSATLVMVSKDEIAAVDRLAGVIEKEAVNVFFLTTALFNTLVEHNIDALKNVRKILFGGEQISVPHARKALEFLGKGRIIHVYGPTETTVFSTYHFIDHIPATAPTIPIGSPLANATTYILDKYDQPVPIAVTGHLHIGGDGLARGYLNNPELTNNKFVAKRNKSFGPGIRLNTWRIRVYASERSVPPNIAGAGFLEKRPMVAEGKLYKSGDLCRWLPGGEIEFVGRIDHQVKIRGFRIELGEIANRLMSHAKIKEAEVTAWKNPQGDKILCAYIVPVSENGEAVEIDNQELKDHIAEILPTYMVPAHFVKLEAMPLTPNGKINRKALPDPGQVQEEDYVAPRDETETQLVRIWQEILGIETIGVRNQFFQLGGNSLNIVNLASFIQRDFEIKVTVAQLFRHDTIEKQAQLLASAPKDVFASIPAAPQREYYPAASVQRRLFFLQFFDPNNTSYNSPQMYTLQGDFSKEKLENVFRQLMERHESLRTSFHMIDDESMIKIHAPESLDFSITEFTLEDAGKGLEPAAAETAIVNSFIRPFDLSQAPLFRVGLLHLAADRAILMLDIHHIVTDGVSYIVIKREFAAFYNGEKLPPLRIQYKDFVEWTNSEEQQERIRKQETYWIERFSGELPLLDLPTDYDRPTTQNFEGDGVHFQLSPSVTRSLKELASTEEVTLYMVLLSLYNLVLSRLSGQEDIVVGTSLAGRRHTDLEGIIGMFVNALALRNYPAADKSFREFLAEVKDNTLEAFENQDYQFEDLVEKISAERIPGRNPLFDVMMVLNNEGQPDAEIPGLLMAGYPFELKSAQMDLKLRMLEARDTLYCVLEYSTSLFSETTIQRMARYFQTAAVSATANPDLKIAEIDILPQEEKEMLLVDFNKDQKPYPLDIPIHRLFEDQVQRTPGHTAAVADSVNEHISYDELNKKSNRIARLLNKNGITTESVSGLMIEPSIDMTAGLLGILKAGAAYCPIEVDLPADRAKFLLEDSRAPLLLTNGASLDKAAIPFTSLLDIETNAPIKPIQTAPRSHIKAFDALPRPDRSLIDLTRYKDKIGMASVTRCISLQATRGCPYECLFCHKVWSKRHVFRSAENIFSEVQYYYQRGVRNFAFIDDCFNLDKKNSSKFFQLVLENKMDIQIFFPNGLRGDLLTPEYIDLMVEAGTRGINLSLETASPRLQKLIKKHLDIEKFKDVMDYIATKHPSVILEIATMHGFPTETEEEAMMTLDFIKSIQWIHFPYIHILKVYPNTEMEAFALEHGVSKADILASKDLAFHELPETLPFPKRFTREYQSDFMNNYFLNKERLKQVIPVQLEVMGDKASAQKYDTYLPVDIKSMRDIIEFAKIENFDPFTAAQEKAAKNAIKASTPSTIDIFEQPHPGFQDPPAAKRILLLDLSQHFSSRNMLYNVVEQPLGPIYLLTYLKQEFGDRITGRVYKSGIDFDSFAELEPLIEDFRPDLIGIRSLTFYKEFFHETVALLRQWGLTVPIIAGGPYATSDYETILKDGHTDLVVFGEGEYTVKEIIAAMLEEADREGNQGNKLRMPSEDVLQNIAGIAYVKKEEQSPGQVQSRTVLTLDHLSTNLAKEDASDRNNPVNATHLAYVMYTSGSTGTPKGVMVEHRQANNCIWWMQDMFGYQGTDAIVQRTNLSFDPSVWELFWPLSQGGKVKLLDTYRRKDAQYLIELMQNPGDAFMMYCTATLVSAFTYLLNNTENPGQLNLKWLIIGAEPIAMETVKNFYQYYQGTVVNTYGPTECAINNTYYELERDDTRSVVPIGKPVTNNQIYILSPQLQLLPLKVAGEICIAGDAVARGYIYNQQKTDENFIDNPFGPGKLYKTGDIGRWLEDGLIEILGRVDEQVKIRGHRIEPGEIEAALATHSAVEKCLVLAIDTKKARKDIRYCKKCGIGSNYPGIVIDDSGTCEVCNNFNKTKRFFDNYFKKLDDLEETIHSIVERYDTEQQQEEAPAQTERQYDCLLLYSGGRGSAYALYQLVDRGFKVLALTYDNGYFSKRDLDNIQRITDSLGVDHVTLTHPNTDPILKQSIAIAHTVCRGCYHTSGALAAQYAAEHNIPLVIGATLSRGQIIENKLFMFAHQDIEDIAELEKEVKNVQQSAIDIDKDIFDLIGIDSVSDRSVYETVSTLDFYRYCDITNEEMIRYLNERDSYWKKRKNFAIYSTNCPIKQIGDFGHLHGPGYHYYGSATSWERRLGHITLDNLREDLQCNVTANGYKKFLERIDAMPVELQKRDEKYLVAYYVPSKEIEPSDLRAFLAEKVPPYMVPSYFVAIDDIPLTLNGKVDKKKLPAPTAQSSSSKTYVKPETPIQETLAAVFSEVLGTPTAGIGLEDNFFELGGDSIKAIQVTARLQKHKLKLDISRLFLNPTIRDLSACIGGIDREIPQGPVSGDVPLTPIQQRFFAEGNPEQHHFNQSVMLHQPRRFQVVHLEKVLQKLVEHHDALRMVYKTGPQSPPVIEQVNRGLTTPLLLLPVYDLRDMAAGKAETYRAEICERIQSSFNLAEGPLFKAALFQSEDGDHLALVAHHLIVDGISWRILLEDLEIAYRQSLSGEELVLQDKTDSFKYWAEQLENYSGGEQALAEVSYWQEVENGAKESGALILPGDHQIPSEQRTYGELSAVTMELDQENTTHLITDAHRAFNTEINDLLVSALVLAIAQWTYSDKTCIALEGHGREPIMDINLSRTVGWFTSYYPVLFSTGYGQQLPEVIKEVKETLRRVPHKGIGYGILRYLNSPEKKDVLPPVFDIQPAVLFNYLGQVGQSSQAEADTSGENNGQDQPAFGFSPLSAGSDRSPATKCPEALTINGGIMGGKLGFTFGFSPQEFNKETIETLAQSFTTNLRNIIDYCLSVETQELTAADFDAPDMDQDELESIYDELDD